MGGTRSGGLKAAQTNKDKHGDDFYSRIGKMGGRNGHTGGFAANPALARIAGRKGGLHRRGAGYHRRNVEKVFENGKEITKILVHKIPTKPQEVIVNVNN